jgi:hypothetical protein
VGGSRAEANSIARMNRVAAAPPAHSGADERNHGSLAEDQADSARPEPSAMRSRFH